MTVPKVLGEKLNGVLFAILCASPSPFPTPFLKNRTPMPVLRLDGFSVRRSTSWAISPCLPVSLSPLRPVPKKPHVDVSVDVKPHPVYLLYAEYDTGLFFRD